METQAPQNPQIALWIKLLLALSLAANLLIAGIFIGSGLNPDRPGGGRLEGAQSQPARATGRLLRELGLGPFIAGFPQDMRRQMARELRDALGPRRAEREALLQELQDMLEILQAEPFDPVAFSAVLDRQKQRLSDRAEAGRDVVVNAISRLSPSQRATLARSFEAAMQAARQRAEAREKPPTRP